MKLQPAHSFVRHDTFRYYALRVGGQADFTLDFHLVVGKPAIAIAQLVEAANADRAALNTVGQYAERMDKMADTYHSAPLWKRVWWALTNDLPFVVKEG